MADLEAAIGRFYEVLRPVCLDEGSSRRPHAGGDRGGPHRFPLPDATQPPRLDGGVAQVHTKTHEPPRRRRRTCDLSSARGSAAASKSASRSGSPTHVSATLTALAGGFQPPYRTCVGESQVTCDIDAEGRVIPIGGGRLFHRRIAALVEMYMPRLHVLWAYGSTGARQNICS